MRFSIFSLMQWPVGRSPGDVFRSDLDRLSLAEAQGYYCAWLAEQQPSNHGIGPAIHLSAANLATRTNTIRIGAAITILPFMHPLRVAEEVAMLDILSEGRVEWSVGRDDQGHEIEGLGVDIDKDDENDENDRSAASDRNEKGDRVFHEQLEIIQRAWTGQPFAHAGEFYEFDELQCFPSPVQDPRPAIHIASRSADATEWAAHNHYRVLAGPFLPTANLAEQRNLYIEAAAAVGTDASAIEIPTVRQIYVGESMKQAREEAMPALLQYSSTPSLKEPEGSSDFLFDECAIIGDAAYCRDRIAQLRETIDLTQLITWQNFGNLSHEQAQASQARFIDQVAPAFV